MHKKNESMFELMFELGNKKTPPKHDNVRFYNNQTTTTTSLLDDFGHFVGVKKDTAALIARLFYNHRNSAAYRGKKLQDALDQAILDKEIGN
jgi:urease accessory protein UreE